MNEYNSAEQFIRHLEFKLTPVALHRQSRRFDVLCAPTVPTAWWRIQCYWPEIEVEVFAKDCFLIYFFAILEKVNQHAEKASTRKWYDETAVTYIKSEFTLRPLWATLLSQSLYSVPYKMSAKRRSKNIHQLDAPYGSTLPKPSIANADLRDILAFLQINIDFYDQHEMSFTSSELPAAGKRRNIICFRSANTPTVTLILAL